MGQPNPGQECTADPLATRLRGQRTVRFLAQVGWGGGWAGPGATPQSLRAGASRDSQPKWGRQSGQGSLGGPAAAWRGLHQQGVVGSSVVLPPPAEMTRSSLVKDRCCG